MPTNLRVLAQIMERVEKLDEVDVNYLIDRLREIQNAKAL